MDDPEESILGGVVVEGLRRGLYHVQGERSGEKRRVRRVGDEGGSGQFRGHIATVSGRPGQGTQGNPDDRELSSKGTAQRTFAAQMAHGRQARSPYPTEHDFYEMKNIACLLCRCVCLQQHVKFLPSLVPIVQPANTIRCYDSVVNLGEGKGRRQLGMPQTEAVHPLANLDPVPSRFRQRRRAPIHPRKGRMPASGRCAAPRSPQSPSGTVGRRRWLVAKEYERVRRSTASGCAAMHPTAAFAAHRWRSARVPAPGPGSATECPVLG